jgi:hypothetical protein
MSIQESKSANIMFKNGMEGWSNECMNECIVSCHVDNEVTF